MLRARTLQLISYMCALSTKFFISGTSASGITFITSSDNCPGLSDRTCGPQYHFPFDDVNNEDRVCGRPDFLSLSEVGWVGKGRWATEAGPEPIKRVPGVSGHALFLDGTENQNLYLEIPGNECLAGVESCPDGFTFAFWLKPSFDSLASPGGRRSLGSRRTKDNVILAVQLGENGRMGSFIIRKRSYKKSKTSSSILFTLRTIRTTFREEIVGTLLRHQIKIRQNMIPDDMWTHVTCRWNMSLRQNERLIVFINRKRVKGKISAKRKRTSVRHIQTHAPPMRMVIGSLGINSGGQSGTRMAMDELQIWKRPLSKEEIQTLSVYPGCPSCWRQQNGRCFRFNGEPAVHEDAVAYCQLKGGNLTLIADKDDLEFVVTALIPKGSSPAWVDGTKFEGMRASYDHVQEYDYDYTTHYTMHENGPYPAHLRAKPDSYIGKEWAGLFNGLFNTPEDTSDVSIGPEENTDVARPSGGDDVQTIADISEGEYDSILPSYEYILDDRNIVSIEEPPPASLCYVINPQLQTTTEVKCHQLSPFVCEIGINECLQNTHRCGDYQCVDLHSGYTCECPSSTKWNGEVCQGTRNKDDYCSMVTMFSRFLASGFCKRRHFQIVCPRECEVYVKRKMRFRR